MIIIPVKEGESIDRALKRYKRKYEKTGVVKELRNRQKFTKPSVIKREAMQKAIYVQKLRQGPLPCEGSALNQLSYRPICGCKSTTKFYSYDFFL